MSPPVHLAPLFSQIYWRFAGKRRRLGTVMLIITLPPLIISMLLLGLLVAQNTAESLEREEGNKLVAEARFFSELTDLTIGRQLLDIQSRAASIATLGLLDRPIELSRWIKTIQQSIPEYTWIGFANLSGDIVAASGDQLVDGQVRFRDWFMQGGLQPITIDVQDMNLLEARMLPVAKPWRFVDVAAPVVDASGLVRGVLGAHLSWEWLTAQHHRFEESLSNKRQAEVIVVDDDGSIRLIGPGGPRLSLNELESFQRASRHESGWLKERWADGRSYLVGYTRNPGFGDFHQLGWVTLVRLPVEAVSGLTTPAIEAIWRSFIAAVLIFLLGLWVLSRMTLVPIQNLIQQIREAAQRKGMVDLNQATTEEFHILSKVTNELVEAVQERQSADHAKTQFLAELSHELRTPLNGISGYAYLLEPRLTDHQDLHDIKAILSHSKAMENILNQALDISLIESNQLKLSHKPFLLDECVGSCADLARISAAGKHLEFFLEADFPKDLLVLGDPTRLAQVINILLNNALKYTQQGRVSLHVSSRPQDDRNVLINISVRDTGPGIQEDQQALIFRRFKRLRTSDQVAQPGNGLGLAIAERIIREMHGQISVTSQPGRGATFNIAVTMAQGQPAVAVATPPEQISWANRDAAVQTRPRAQRSILIVDDIDTNRDILVRFLEQLGHRVEESATGQNAIVKAVSRPFDLILMDIDLPDMTGWKAATAIKAPGSASAAACVVAVSGHAYLRDVAASEAAGMSGHLTKPVEFEKLKELIRQLDPS